MSVQKLLYTIPEAYEALSLSRSKFYELMSAGEIKVIKIGASVRVPVSELESFVERRLAGTNKETETAP